MVISRMSFLRKAKRPVFLIMILFCLAAAPAWPAAGKVALAREAREAIVKRVASEFRAKYFSAQLAEAMAANIEGSLAAGAYDGLGDVPALAARLQEDLRSVSRDLHVKVLPGVIPDFDSDVEMLRRENYGFTAVEVLPGNIGYVDFFQFYAVKDAGATAIAAMNFVANCDALIVDLRSNGGGYPEMRSLICSYLFAAPTHLLDFRGRDGVIQDWTLPHVPGRRLPDVPVYVLVGRPTFSCAEDFAFCLQSLGRATIVGEATGGGAHDCKLWTFPEEGISLQIPFNEAVDPRGGKNWEGTGIKPDVAVPGRQAFRTAMRLAAQRLLQGETDEERRRLLEWIAQDYDAQLEPPRLKPAALRACAGRYGSYRVSLEQGELSLAIDGSMPRRLLPIAADDFRMPGDDRHGYAMARVLFTRDARGRVDGLVIHTQEGTRFPKKARQ